MKSTKVFKSGGSFAVRLPKAWVPQSGKVLLKKEGNRIIMTEEGANLRSLAKSFAEDGLLDFSRPRQLSTQKRKL